MAGRIIILVAGVIILTAGLFLLRASSKKIPPSVNSHKDIAFGDQPHLIDSSDSRKMPRSAGSPKDFAFGDQPPLIDPSSSQKIRSAPAHQKPAPRVRREVNRVESSPKGRALYEKNCFVCHGLRGKGNGPGAVGLDVRPRDFRTDPFKYVSAESGRPTREDLRRTIRHGRILGRMPAFRHLEAGQIDALIDYIAEIRRLGLEEKLTAASRDNPKNVMTPEKIAMQAREMAAFGEEVKRADPLEAFKLDPDRAGKLFALKCASCHGDAGRGDGKARPKNEKGEPIKVRDLREGRFQGGTEARELFWRIRCGIPGTPMTAQKDLRDEDIWQLVYYVKSIAP